MGQSNESENPELILEKLKTLTIHDENKMSLEKSFHYIRNILNDYKFYKDIIEKNNNNNRKTVNFFGIHKFSSSHEYSKSELIKFNGQYDKNIIQDVNHTIERIKKWVKMVKKPFSNNKDDDDNSFSNNNNESAQNIEDNKETISNDNNINKGYNKHKSSNDIRKNKITKNKKIILSNYTDKKIENGIAKYRQNQKSKFIDRIKKGPPDCFRWAGWCIINNLPLDRDNTIYENYTNMSLEKDNKDRIIRDIQRTFSDKKIEKNELRKMEKSLYKVLKAFWNLDKEIGYCQGMNLLVGLLLILSDFNERDSFYLLVSNFSDTFKIRKKNEYNFRGLFIEEFPLLYFLNYIFDSLLGQHVGDLKNHLENMGISIDLWMGKWFQTLFTIILPINWCKRLWDNIFAENIFFLVKFGIAFSMMIKDDILKMDEEVEIIQYFKDFEKYSLCYDNDFLNEKNDVYSIILKSKKIKIDIDYYLKNYEKNEENGKGFSNKMEKIKDVKYHFYQQLVAKPSIETILFSDDDNHQKSKNPSIHNNNGGVIITNNINNNDNDNDAKQKNEIIIINDEDNKEDEPRLSIKNNNKPITLKGGSFHKRNNTINDDIRKKILLSNDIDNDNDNGVNAMTERKNNKIIANINNINNKNKNSNNKNSNINIDNNNINNSDKDSNNKNSNINIDNNNINNNDNDNDNDSNNKNSNSNIENNNSENINEDSINDSYYQNVNENIHIDDSIYIIIKNNLDSHQFEKFRKQNKLGDLTSNNNVGGVFTRDSDVDISSNRQKEKKENIGIHIPNENDISTFIGKHKFSKSTKKTKNKSNNKINFIFDNEKINQWC